MLEMVEVSVQALLGMGEISTEKLSLWIIPAKQAVTVPT